MSVSIKSTSILQSSTDSACYECSGPVRGQDMIAIYRVIEMDGVSRIAIVGFAHDYHFKNAEDDS